MTNDVLIREYTAKRGETWTWILQLSDCHPHLYHLFNALMLDMELNYEPRETWLADALLTMERMRVVIAIYATDAVPPPKEDT